MHDVDVNEVSRHASPGNRPQPLAFHEGVLWVGSWETSHLYAIDTKTWSVIHDVEAPGQPFGLTSFGDGLRAVISHGEDDDRYLYRFVPGSGFDLASKTACPDFTGSHVTTDGTLLYLIQATNRRILVLDADATVRREIALPSRCAGACVHPDGRFFMIAADEEFDELELATLDVAASEPQLTMVAPMSAEARALAFDGNAWWTSYRELNEIVSFAPIVAR